MTTLAEFLLVRIAEDEQTARAAAAGPWGTKDAWLSFTDKLWRQLDEDETVDHIARPRLRGTGTAR